jgi:signal transduction histidine kinase
MDTITHELKTPLTVIDGHVELLEEDSTASVASVRAIRRGTERLQRMVADLLLLARVKDPHVVPQRVPVDLAEVVSEVEDLFSVEVRRRALTLSTPGVRPGVVAWGDRQELTRAVLNVVGNAVKYTPAGGTVTLRLQRDPGSAVFTCADTGIGIDPADHPHLFEEFNRSSNPEAHAISGTGLGLAIVKRIVERHDGTISVASCRGHGSTFRIEVPTPPPGHEDPGP